MAEGGGAVSIRKTTVVLHRTSMALCALVLMPTGIAQTLGDPSDYHIVLLITCMAWTAVVCVLYRRAVAKWEEDDRG